MPNHTSKLFSILCLGTLSGWYAGCTYNQPLKTQTSLSLKEPEPPVIVDRISQLPKAQETVQVRAGVASLRVGNDAALVYGLVHRFFQAYRERSLVPILSDLDSPLQLFTSYGERTRLRTYFETDFQDRTRNLPYDQLEVDQMYRSVDIEIWTYEQLTTKGPSLRPASMGPNDLFVRVPMQITTLGTDNLFPGEVKFVLRRKGRTLVIRGVSDINGR